MRYLLFLLAIVAHLWLLNSLGLHRSAASLSGQATPPHYQSVTLSRADAASRQSSEMANQPAVQPATASLPATTQAVLSVTESKAQLAAVSPPVVTASPAVTDDNLGQSQKDFTQEQQSAASELVYASYLNAPNPAYPEQARRLGYQGKVLLNLLVGSNGNVEKVRLLQSSGYAILDDAAIDSLSDWLFVPTMLDGKPVAYWYAQYVAFQLTPAGQAEVSS